MFLHSLPFTFFAKEIVCGKMFVSFQKGKDMSGVADLPMADQLYHYMVGGHKRPLVSYLKLFSFTYIVFP